MARPVEIIITVLAQWPEEGSGWGVGGLKLGKRKALY
jgi:hypothetical protein